MGVEKKLLLTVHSVITRNIPYLFIRDFNLPLISWPEFNFPSNEKYQIMKKFLLKNQPIHQVISFPTRGNNILDLAWWR